MDYKLFVSLVAIFVPFLVKDVMSHRDFLASVQACEGGVTLNGSSGRVASPGWNHYAGNLSCKWTVLRPAGTTMKIRVRRFDVRSWTTACARDYVIMYDGPTKLGKFCTANRPQEEFTTNTNNLTIVLHTYPYNFGGKGFYMRWSGQYEDPLPLEQVMEIVRRDRDDAEDPYEGQAVCLGACACESVINLDKNRIECQKCIEGFNEKCGGTCEASVMAKCQERGECPKRDQPHKIPAEDEDNFDVIACRGCVDRCLNRVVSTCGIPNPGWIYRKTPNEMTWQESRDWCKSNFTGDIAVMGVKDNKMRKNVMQYLGISMPTWLGLTVQEGQWVWVGDTDRSPAAVMDKNMVKTNRKEPHCGAVYSIPTQSDLQQNAIKDRSCDAQLHAICAKKCATTG